MKPIIVRQITLEVNGMERDDDGKSIKVTLSRKSDVAIYNDIAFIRMTPEEAEGLRFGARFTLVGFDREYMNPTAEMVEQVEQRGSR